MDGLKAQPAHPIHSPLHEPPNPIRESIMILALDLATKTGWALVQDSKILESGVWDFAQDRGTGHYGFLFQALYRKLDLYAKPGTQIAFELAHHRAGPATRIGVGMNATVLLFAARRDMPAPLAVHTATLKKAITGSGKGDKGLVKAWASSLLGRPPIDDNEADAIAVGVWAENSLSSVKTDQGVTNA